MIQIHGEANILINIIFIVSQFSDLFWKQLMPLSETITSKLIMQIERCWQQQIKGGINTPNFGSIMCHLRPVFSFSLSVADFQKLQEAKEILCNETKRKNYDLWKRGGVNISFHDWQALNDSVKTVSNVFGIWWFSKKGHLYNKKLQCCIWLPVCSQCTGLWEIRRNQCWRPQKQKS